MIARDDDQEDDCVSPVSGPCATQSNGKLEQILAQSSLSSLEFKAVIFQDLPFTAVLRKPQPATRSLMIASLVESWHIAAP